MLWWLSIDMFRSRGLLFCQCSLIHSIERSDITSVVAGNWLYFKHICSLVLIKDSSIHVILWNFPNIWHRPWLRIQCQSSLSVEQLVFIAYIVRFLCFLIFFSYWYTSLTRKILQIIINQVYTVTDVYHQQGKLMCWLKLIQQPIRHSYTKLG